MNRVKSTGQIIKAKYRLLRDEDIEKISVVDIFNENIYSDINTIAPGGVCDLKLGTVSSNECETCYKGMTECPGHFGKINLDYMLKVPITYSLISKWLSLICTSCSKFLVLTTDIENHPMNTRTNWLSNKIKYINGIINCVHCNAINYKYDIIKFGESRISYGDIEIHNEQLFEIFSKVSDDMCELIGFSTDVHPKYYITKYILITPNNVRSTSGFSGGANTTIDGITKTYRFMLDSINRIRSIDRNISDTITKEEKIKKRYDTIYELEEAYYNLALSKADNSSMIFNNNGAPVKTLLSILEKKEGLIRDSVQGKRLEQVARSVIVGESTIPIDEIIISKKMAMSLYQEILVTDKNIAEMYLYYENGNTKYPGCYGIIRNGNTKKIDMFKNIVANSPGEIKPFGIGDKILRHLIDGDSMLFNRQPSLWWCNMSQFKIKVLEGEWAFRFNEMICVYYNADFDGDEMNMYFLNSTMAKIEIKYLSSIKNWAISFKGSECFIGFQLDAILGVALLTREDTKMSRKMALHLFNQTDLFVDIPRDKKILKGKDIITILLQNSGCIINYKNKSKTFTKYAKAFGEHPNDERVVISNGVHVKGILDSSSLQQVSTNSIFRVVFNEYGSDIANKLAFNLQQIANEYIRMRGFTLSTEDILIKETQMNKLKDKISETVKESKIIHYNYLSNQLVPSINETLDEFYENSQLGTLTLDQDFIDTTMSFLDINNNLYRMMASGSKGAPPYIMEAVASHGQVTTHGVRAPKTVAGRASMFSTRNSFDPKSRGFVAKGLMEGVDNEDTVFLSSRERLGLHQKCNSVSETGYGGRLLIKSFEMEMISNFRGVLVDDNIIQVLYGGDGIDIRYREKNVIKGIDKSDDIFMKIYKNDIKNINKIYQNDNVKAELEAEFEEILRSRKEIRENTIPLEYIHESYSFNDVIYLPIDIKRTIRNNNTIMENKKVLDPVKAIKDLKDALKRIQYIHTNLYCMENKIKLPTYITEGLGLHINTIKILLCTNKLIKYGLSNDEFTKILDIIHMKYINSLIEPGLASGILMSHCINQPLTQAMLNSIHKGSKGGDIEAIKDIINVRNKQDDLKRPYMRFTPKSGVSAKDLVKKIEMIKLSELISDPIYILERSIKDLDKVFKDKRKMTECLENMLLPDLTNISFRIRINKFQMVVKNIDTYKITISLNKHFETFKIHSGVNKYDVKFAIIHSDMKEEVIILLYLRDIPDIKLDLLREQVDDHIRTCIVSGVNGISNVEIVEFEKSKILDDGSIQKFTYETITTSGINIEDIYNHPDIDPGSIKHNYIKGIAEDFGIIMVEQLMISELKLQIDISDKWLTSLSASLNFGGFPVSANSHGTFAKFPDHTGLHISTEHFRKSVEHAVKDSTEHYITGLSESLLVSNNVQFGTGYNTPIINDEFIKNNKPFSYTEENLLF